MDTTEFGGDRAHKERIVELSVGLFRALGNFPKPVVAAINGPAVAGGFALALLCDMRLASTDARMGFLENRPRHPAELRGRACRVACRARRGAMPDRTPARRRRGGRPGRRRPRCTLRTNLMPRAQALAEEIAAAPPSASIETKRRILIERETCWRPLFEAEEQRARRRAARALARASSLACVVLPPPAGEKRALARDLRRPRSRATLPGDRCRLSNRASASRTASGVCPLPDGAHRPDWQGPSGRRTRCRRAGQVLARTAPRQPSAPQSTHRKSTPTPSQGTPFVARLQGGVTTFFHA